jgi:hypothetical protein
MLHLRRGTLNLLNRTLLLLSWHGVRHGSRP